MPSPQFPPAGHLPLDYITEDNSRPLLATCISFLIIETFFMVLLHMSRFLSSEQKANWNMVALMTGAYLVCICKITLGLLAVRIGGAGHHAATLSYKTITTALQLNTALQLVCPLTTSLSKMSILCMFHTIFGRTSPRYRLVIRLSFALCLIILIVQVLIPFANCKPFSATWTLGAEDACAINGLYLWRYLSIPNVVTTFIVVAIPVPALYKLHVSAVTKLGLSVVLTVCVAGVAAAIMRVLSFLAVKSFRDFSYEQIGPLCWTIAESGIYMVAGVLPTLTPLMRKVFGGVRFKKISTGKSRTAKSGVSAGSSGNERGSQMAKADVIALVHQKTFSVVSNGETAVWVEDEESGKA